MMIAIYGILPDELEKMDSSVLKALLSKDAIQMKMMGKLTGV